MTIQPTLAPRNNTKSPLLKQRTRLPGLLMRVSPLSSCAVHLALSVPRLPWSCLGPILLKTQPGFRCGKRLCHMYQSPSANQIIHILYLPTAWNVFVGKKLLFGRSLGDGESHLLQFRHAVGRFIMYFLFDSFQLPGANIHLPFPLMGSDL